MARLESWYGGFIHQVLQNCQYLSIYSKHIRNFVKILRVSCYTPSCVVDRLPLGLSVANDVLVSLMERDRIINILVGL